MVNQKQRIYSVDIEAFIDRLCQLIVGDLENSGQATAEHVGRLFRGELENLAYEKAKKTTTICVQNRMHVGNTKEIRAILI